jgi:hypothetical protein
MGNKKARCVVTMKCPSCSERTVVGGTADDAVRCCGCCGGTVWCRPEDDVVGPGHTVTKAADPRWYADGRRAVERMRKVFAAIPENWAARQLPTGRRGKRMPHGASDRVKREQ